MCRLFAAVAIASLFCITTLTKAETPASHARVLQATELGTARASAPMEKWGGRPGPAVMARINGKGPFRLDVDTGTTMTALIDDSVAKELGLPIPKEVPSLGMAEESEPIEVDSITIGNVMFSKVRVWVADFDSFMPAGPDTPVGILGLPLFEDCLLTFDYPNQRFIFENGELSNPGGEIIEYSQNPDTDFGITITSIVAGTPIRTHIDTGSPAFLTLLTKWQNKLPLSDKPQVIGQARTPSGATEVSTAKLDGTVSVGAHKFPNPRIDFADLGPMVDFDCANIGSRLLEDFAMTIDQKNRRIRLSRGNTKNAPVVQKMRRGSDSPYKMGVAFLPSPDGWKVSMVAPDSAAQTAGIKPQDVVKMVNGKPIGEIPGRELGKIFGSPEPVLLEILRGDETLSVSVTPQKQEKQKASP